MVENVKKLQRVTVFSQAEYQNLLKINLSQVKYKLPNLSCFLKNGFGSMTFPILTQKKKQTENNKEKREE